MGSYDNNFMLHGINEYEPTISTYTEEFPNQPTNKTGHYTYMNAFGEHETTFLNCANNISGLQAGEGGFQFHSVNSIQADKQLAKITREGLTIDKSTTGTPVIYSPNILNLDGNGRNINFPIGTNLTNAPYNMTQVFNPIYMTQTTSLYTSGTLCYAVLASDASIQIFNNNNTTNPIPPNVVPSDFGNSSNVGFTVGIPVFTLNLPTPSIIQTAILNENLTITTDTDVVILSSNELTFNNINIKMNQVIPTLVYSSPVIYADGYFPTTNLTIRNTYGYNGWYFKNTAPTRKINWYFPPKTPTTTKVSDLKGISISFFNGNNTSNDNTLFITIYTVPTGSGDFAPGFFHSSQNYIFNQTITPIINTTYQGVCIIDKNEIPFNYETQIQYELSTTRGSYLPTDNILAVVIQTSSSSPTNSVELVVNKLNLHYYDFTQSYLLISP